MDPLVEKYSNISGFCYVKDNPLKFVDFKGEEPTASEAARMAAHVYGDKKNILINGWKVSNKSFGAIKLVNSKSGLNSTKEQQMVRQSMLMSLREQICLNIMM